MDSTVPGPEVLDDTPVPFAAVDIRTALSSRPQRPPDFAKEDLALACLAAELAQNPQNLLQKLAETALGLCYADTAGISLLETHSGNEVFRWEALAGACVAERNNTMPRHASPSGVCIDENATQLMHLPDRCFPALPTEPRFVETLLVPFRHEGRPIGAVWVVTHRFDRKFDLEDERVMRTLAAFASAGWQLWRSTAVLVDANAALRKEIEIRRQAEEELRGAHQALENVSAMLLKAEENERRLLAHSMVDNLSQRLVALSLEAAFLSKSFPDTTDINSVRVHDLCGKINLLAVDIFQVSRHLHPVILDDFGLAAAFKAECDDFSRRWGGRVHFEAKDLPERLPAEIALTLYRVAQQGLSNVEKHADSREVRVRLSHRNYHIALFVADIGRGFDIRQTKDKGAGFMSMIERIRRLRGRFRISSRPGKGTLLIVRIPMPQSEAPEHSSSRG